MTNYEALREAALAAMVPHAGAADDRFYAAAKPATLVELVDELLALRAQVGKPAKAPKRNDYPPEFEEAWEAYPVERQGTKRTAFKKWEANIKRGVEPGEILLGLHRYLAHAAAIGTETRFLKLAATFFGPDEHFAAKYVMPTQQAARPGKFDPVAHVNKNRNTGKDWDDGIIDINPR